MTSRRHFIAAAGTAMFAGLPTRAVAQQGGEIRLGVASYSLRKKTLAESIQALKLMNIRYLKVKLEAHLPFTSTPSQIEDAKKMITDAGIVLESTGNNPLQKDEAEIRMKFEFNKKLGVPLMIIAPTMKTLPIVEKYVKEYDIKVALHNHGPEDPHFPTAKSVLTAVQELDPRVGLCIDIGHSARTGEDVVAAIRAAGPRLLDFDAKDLRRKMEASSQCDVGDGELPIAAMFRELLKIKYAGIVHLEYEINENDPVPGMQRSFSYMRGIIAGLKV
jgi:sugar phosphate isomerase/epimerase